MDNIFYYLAFSHCLGIGPVRFKQLREYFDEDLKSAYESSEKELQELLGSALTQEFVKHRNEFDPIKKMEELRKKDITLLTQEDDIYPEQLKNINDTPICLYVKGNLEHISFTHDRFFAIVGTRKATQYGLQVARKIASELAEAGITVVSGMALGIDSAAHQGALDGEGKTIAFLGCGVDIVYPPTNKGLYDRIVKDGGLIISEFPPGMTVLPGLFVARNRLISGLSHGVMVVEGEKKSGSLITARFAADQGKDVFAPPAPITSSVAAAPNILLKEGATLVLSVDDILEYYNWQRSDNHINKEALDLSDNEKLVQNKLQLEPYTPNELSGILKLQITSVLHTLSLLEMKGVVKQNSDGKYYVI